MLDEEMAPNEHEIIMEQESSLSSENSASSK